MQPALRQMADADRAGAAAMLREVQRNALFIDTLVLLDADGSVLASHAADAAVLAARARTLPLGTLHEGRFDDRPVVMLREPLPGTGRSLVGVLSLGRIVARVGVRSFGATGAVTIVTASGEVLATSDARMHGTVFGAEGFSRLLRSRVAGVVTFDSAATGRREFAAVAPVRGLALSVVISQDADEVFGSLRGLRRNLGWLALALLGAAAILGGLTVRERRTAFRALGASERRYRDLVEASAGLICEHDLTGRLTMVNPAAAAHLGYVPAEMEGARLQRFVPREHWPDLDAYLLAVARDGIARGLLALRAKSGAVQLWEYANRLYAEPGRAAYVIGHAQDVTERRAREAALRDEGQRDALTGAFNRRWLESFEQAALDTVWGCIVIDIDRFKEINDTYGHKRGDDVLVQVARLLLSHARHGDAVVRMGGDEFAILIADGLNGAVDAMSARLRDDGAAGTWRFSVGAATRENGERLAQTLDRADLRLYAGRSESRNSGSRAAS